MPAIAHLECTVCQAKFSADRSRACPNDGGILFVRYAPNLAMSSRGSLTARESSMWRYSDFLPEVKPVSLGEGFTPLLSSNQFPNVHVKNEGGNPTGSIADRAMSMAVSIAIAGGGKDLVIASTEECGRSVAAYAARVGAKAHIFAPPNTTADFKAECEFYDADVTVLPGVLDDRRRIADEYAKKHNAINLSAFTPFRIEGLKTLGYEILEQLQWQMPHAIICPMGDGAAIAALGKAFEEMEAAKWIDSARPKIVGVTTDADDNPHLGEWRLAHEMAAKNGWIHCTVTDAIAYESAREWAAKEGISASPQGAASLGAYRQLRTNRTLGPDDKVVLVNTCSGRGHLDISSEAGQRPASRNIGGIIGPY